MKSSKSFLLENKDLTLIKFLRNKSYQITETFIKSIKNKIKSEPKFKSAIQRFPNQMKKSKEILNKFLKTEDFQQTIELSPELFNSLDDSIQNIKFDTTCKIDFYLTDGNEFDGQYDQNQIDVILKMNLLTSILENKSINKSKQRLTYILAHELYHFYEEAQINKFTNELKDTTFELKRKIRKELRDKENVDFLKYILLTHEINAHYYEMIITILDQRLNINDLSYDTIIKFIHKIFFRNNKTAIKNVPERLMNKLVIKLYADLEAIKKSNDKNLIVNQMNKKINQKRT